MAAEAHFCCRQNSHPFQERHVILKEPAKIGRSVARCRPSGNNAVFDCKVLSRNHALLWYENGKFFLQDTKSSNGTFVNNQRLSKASEESPAVELNSCDVVQFGVDVVDSTRKVTHGCIVSQLRLYLPNGEESKQSSNTWNTSFVDKVPFNNSFPVVQSQDLYQLHQYLQEAMHREQMLEQKLALLQRLISNSHDASEKGWQALIDEDKLLSRLEFLENQLQTYKTQNEETFQEKLQQLQEEKYNYENTSKETLRQALQEKLEAVQKLSNLEHSLGNTEDECTHLKLVREQIHTELMELAQVHQVKVKENEEISDKLKEADQRQAQLQLNLDEMSKELAEQGERHLAESEQLQLQLNKLQQENDLLRAKNDAEVNRTNKLDHQLENDFILFRKNSQHLSEKLCNDCRLKFLPDSPPPIITPPEADVAKSNENLASTNQLSSSASDVNHCDGHYDVTKPPIIIDSLHLKESAADMEQTMTWSNGGIPLIDCALADVKPLNREAMKPLNRVESPPIAEHHRAEEVTSSDDELRERLLDATNRLQLLQLQLAHVTTNKSRDLQQDEANGDASVNTVKTDNANPVSDAAVQLSQLVAHLKSTVNLMETRGIHLNRNLPKRTDDVAVGDSIAQQDEAAVGDHVVSRDDTACGDSSVSRDDTACGDSSVSRDDTACGDSSVTRDDAACGDASVSRDDAAVGDWSISQCHKWTMSESDEVEVELERCRETLRLRESTIASLQDEVAAAGDKAAELQGLRDEIEELQGLRDEIEELRTSSRDNVNQCENLKNLLLVSRGEVEASNSKLLQLQASLEEKERSLADTRRRGEELERQLVEKSSLVEELSSREREICDQHSAQAQFIQRQAGELSELKQKLSVCDCAKNQAYEDAEALRSQILLVEKEKASICEELKQLKTMYADTEESLNEEISKSETLQKDLDDKESKWMSVLDARETEISEVTARCKQLIQDREKAAEDGKKSGSCLQVKRRHMVGVLLALLVAVLAYHACQQTGALDHFLDTNGRHLAL